MSALAEIHAELERLPKARRGWERAILVGHSAIGSIAADIARGEGSDAEHDEIAGVPVMRTLEFDGWAIREIGPAGRWHDCKAKAS